MTNATTLHPDNTGPDYDDTTDTRPRLVTCPDCGQLEWWTEGELIDHGRCRTGRYPCACDDDAAGRILATINATSGDEKREHA